MTLTEGETQLDHLHKSPGTGNENSADRTSELVEQIRAIGGRSGDCLDDVGHRGEQNAS